MWGLSVDENDRTNVYRRRVVFVKFATALLGYHCTKAIDNLVPRCLVNLFMPQKENMDTLVAIQLNIDKAIT